MAVIVTYGGIPYSIPTKNDVGWAESLTDYLVALSTGALTLSGGNFTLLADVNFGPNFGVVAKYLKSYNTPRASTGVVQLANSDQMVWRNTDNTANLPLYVQDNNLYFAGIPLSGTGTGSPLTTRGDLYTYTTTNARLPVGFNGQGLIADSSQPSGLRWGNIGGSGGSVTGFTFVNANGISGVVTNPTTVPGLTLSLGAITPTTVVASGSVTATNISGTTSGTNTGDQTIIMSGAVTGTGTGAITTTYNGVVPIAKGGTGQVTATAALNALLPSQSGQSTKFLQTNGTNAIWTNVIAGLGTVTSISGSGTQGVTVNITNPTSTPNIVVGLGSISPTNVSATGSLTGASGSVVGLWTSGNSLVIGNQVVGGTIGAAGNITGANLSGINTGDQTLNGLLPPQTGNASKVLTTDGTNAYWGVGGGGGGGTSNFTYTILDI